MADEDTPSSEAAPKPKDVVLDEDWQRRKREEARRAHRDASFFYWYQAALHELGDPPPDEVQMRTLPRAK